MSEYQYYEFLAIDRPLTEDEMEELRVLESQASQGARSVFKEPFKKFSRCLEISCRNCQTGIGFGL